MFYYIFIGSIFVDIEISYIVARVISRNPTNLTEEEEKEMRSHARDI